MQRTSEIVAGAPGAQPERDPALTRLRHGVYANAEDLEQPSRGARHLAQIRAVAAVRRRPMFARQSALALHGIAYGQEPDLVFTTGGTTTARRKAGVVHVPIELDPVDVTEVDGLLVTSLPYALADVARRCDPLVAVAALDEALRLQSVTKQEVTAALGRQSRRGRAAAVWAIDFADAAAESVGESYSRVRIFQLGFAAPELQVRVIGRSGRRYRVDMCWRFADRRPLYGEFDGQVKYGELANKAGKSGAQALAEEKAREDDIRFSGDTAHWVWDEMMSPRRFERVLLAHRVPRIRRPSLALLRTP